MDACFQTRWGPHDDKWIANVALCWQKKAVATYSNVKVGAVVVARNDDFSLGRYALFGACNIEYSKRQGDHAETLAIAKAWMAGFKNIRAIYVTSMSFKEQNYLCPLCAGRLHKVNNKAMIIVVNPDGSIKGKKTVQEVLPFWHDV